MAQDFGTQLWDQWLEVETYTSYTSKSLETLSDFFRKRAEIEVEYAKSLQKLVKPHKDEITRLATDKKAPNPVFNRALLSSSTTQAWTQLLNEAENTAKIHTDLSEKLDNDIKKAVKGAAVELELKLKAKFDEIKRVTADLQKSVMCMDKLRERYEADKKAMEIALAACEKANKFGKGGDIEASKMDSEKKKMAVKTSMEVYQLSLSEVNVKKNQTYTNFLPKLLSQINSDDALIRIEAFKAAFSRYFKLRSAMGPQIQSGLEAMNAVASAIDAAHDVDIAVRFLRTGEPVPPDYLFEEKPIAEITGRKMARSPSAVRAERDEGSDEAILSQPHKTGKKAALERAKQCEKDTAELTKKLESIECMLGVYQTYDTNDAKNPPFIQTIQAQKEYLEIQLTNTGLRSHALRAYLAQADGLRPPELPAYLAGKSIRSATTPVKTTVGSMGVNSPLTTTPSIETPLSLDTDDAPLSTLSVSATLVHQNSSVKVVDDEEWSWQSQGPQNVTMPTSENANLRVQDDDWSWTASPAITRTEFPSENYILTSTVTKPLDMSDLNLPRTAYDESSVLNRNVQLNLLPTFGGTIATTPNVPSGRGPGGWEINAASEDPWGFGDEAKQEGGIRLS